MRSDDNSVIVFNGEIYNFKEIRKLLSLCGYSFKTDCDTEVILYSFQEWGADCVNKFNGMFAFAIWDKLKKELTLVRDPFGKKPLLYSINNKEINLLFEGDAIFDRLSYELRLTCDQKFSTGTLVLESWGVSMNW